MQASFIAAVPYGSNPISVKINENDDVADLCSELKTNYLATELKGIDLTQIFLQSPNSLDSFPRNVKIKELPKTTCQTPLNIVIYDSKYLMTEFFDGGSSRLSGFGSLPSSFKIDATDGYVVCSALCPTDTDINNVSEDMPLMGELMDMELRGEGGEDGVDTIFGISDSLFCSTHNESTTLGNMKLGFGLASPTSKCANYLLMGQKDTPYGFIVLKGAMYSLLQGSRQAAVYGSHFAMGLLKRGFPAEQVIVPSYTYTGMQIQFGATIILKPSFPVYWTISKLLDMSDASDRRLAVAYIQKANSWIQYLDSLPIFQPIPLIEMTLDISLYFIKTLTKGVCNRSFNLFSSRNWDISQGIEHWGRLLNLLFIDLDVRSHVAFPLAIRSPNISNNEKEYMIIFRDMCAEGYQIGCPDRLRESEFFESFRVEYRRIIKKIHGAGVIHCNLYLSNVMWRKRSTKTETESSSLYMVDIVIIVLSSNLP